MTSKRKVVSRFFKSRGRSKTLRKAAVIRQDAEFVCISTNANLPAQHSLESKCTETEQSQQNISQSTEQKLQSFCFEKQEMVDDSEVTEADESKTAYIKPEQSIDAATCSISTESIKYTPLEQQVIDLRENYPGCLLLVECGYKYRFFGSDAEIARDVLHIQCNRDHNFLTASIPTHRLFVHVRRLVYAGYKVGVVKQMETAALKAAAAAGDTGSKSSAVFKRQLTAMYTKSTLIGEDVESGGSCEGDRDISGGMDQPYLMCLYLQGKQHKRSVNLAMMCVNVTSGDTVYDEFNDDPTNFNGLHTRLTHINPSEILLPSISGNSHIENLISFISSFRSSRDIDDRIRIEQICEDWYEDCISSDTDLPSSSHHHLPSHLQDLPAAVFSLPSSIRCCLSALLRYLRDFGLQGAINRSSDLRQFSGVEYHMRLSGETVTNLHLMPAVAAAGVTTSNSPLTSLYGMCVHHCSTRFGARLMRQWILQPLISVPDIMSRQESVTDCYNMITRRDDDDATFLHDLHSALERLPDLERSLCSILHRRCSTLQYYTTLRAMSDVSDVITRHEHAVPRRAALLSDLLRVITDNLCGITRYLDMVNAPAATSGDITKIFTDAARFPTVRECKERIRKLEGEMREHRKEVAAVLNVVRVEYKTVSGCEYLVEVSAAHLPRVPSDWLKVSATKRVTRFRTPYLQGACARLERLRDELLVEARRAWGALLGDVARHVPAYQAAVRALAQIDCIISLASLAANATANGAAAYCRPVILDADSNECVIQITNGRHPILDQITSQYVPNDTKLQTSGVKCMILTGPNMGGKSCYIRQVALIAIMAQIGSYVPADAVSLTPLDAIYTRMGGREDIGRSTYLVELSGVGDMLSECTDRSLLILDELGRGTSTNDGTAIAYATLHYIITKLRCPCIFVTHYAAVQQLAAAYPSRVSSHHMRYLVPDDTDRDVGGDSNTITFLYRVSAPTTTHSTHPISYGVHVARMAGLPYMVTTRAGEISRSVAHEDSRRRQLITDLKLVLSAGSDVNDVRRDIQSLTSHQTNT